MSAITELAGIPQLIETATSTNVKTSAGVVKSIVVVDGTVDVYNDPDSNDNQVISTLASGTHRLEMFCSNGIRVVTTGATVNVTVIYR